MANFLSLEKLKSVLDYDPDTGVFTRTDCRSREFIGTVAGSKNNKGYTVIKINQTAYKAHRLAWLYVYGSWPEGQIDHINGIRADNRIINLRQAGPNINAQNRRRAAKNHNTSKLLGVYPVSHGKRWRAQINLSGHLIHIGVFDTPEEAHQAYVKAKRRLHPGCTL